MDSQRQLKIASFNCKHFKDKGPKFDFIQKLMLHNDVLLLQEHCLFTSHLHKLQGVGNVELVGKSSMNENIMLQGRPFGGCAILYKSNLACKSVVIGCNNDRLCALLLNFSDTCNILLFNVDMPCDSGRVNEDFDDVLNEIEQIIHQINPLHIIVGGDLNTDFNRSTYNSRVLREFVQAQDMNVCIDMEIANVPYTFIGPSSISRIDHFLISSELAKLVVSCNIVDEHLHSDHVPLVITCDLDVNYFECRERSFCGRYCWGKADKGMIDKYKKNLDDILNKLKCDNVMLSCTDTKCTVHVDGIVELYTGIVDACITASNMCIPKTNPGNNGKGINKKNNHIIPGWNEHIEPLRKEALLWHHEWKANGKPHSGHIAEQHRMSRAQYHRALKRIIRECELVKIERMAEALSRNNYRDLWKEIKKIKGRNKNCSRCIDSQSDDSEICNIFKNKYENLYNCVPYNKQELDEIKKEIDDELDPQMDCDFMIHFNEVKEAIGGLKPGKSDGEEGLVSDH